MVLAVLVRPLPKRLQKRALLYGLVGGYVMRGLMLFFVAYLVQLWWAQLGGGGYLVYLSLRHAWRSRHGRRTEEGHERTPEETAGEPRLATAAAATTPRVFWTTVATVELMDLAFAVDSGLVAVAVTKVLWVIYVGVFIGIFMLRLAAGWFVGVMERHPRFEHVAYALVAWAGVKLLVEGAASLCEVLGRPGLAIHLPKPVFWIVTVMLLVGGSVWALRRTEVVASTAPDDDADG